jgi:2-haloacid dehalogenase
VITTIIFDLGSVLVDWNPNYLYRKLFADEQEMQDFLANITTPDWNEEQDAGRPLQEGTDLLIQQHPQHEENIRAFYDRWDEMLGDPIQGTIDLFKQLKESGRYKVYALTNWSAETFPIALERYDFMGWFDGIVVSGVEKICKPAPEFYQLLLDRYNVDPQEALFIDDNLRNVLAAEKMGITSIHFTSPEQLKEELVKRALI